MCVAHHDRGPLLLEALESVRAQTLPAQHLQAIVVDDGSTSEAARTTLAKLERWPEFGPRTPHARRWLLLRQPTSRYLGAARNVAARASRSEFLFFLDDDNAIKPHALLTLVRAARATGAHVLTSPNEKWPSLRRPPEADEATERWLPLGGAATVGLFKNCFGDASALVRRDAFTLLGGFTEDVAVGHEDWELWATAVLRGYTLQVVPEPLYWYRLAGGGMLSESIGGSDAALAQRHANHARNVRPYLERLAAWPEAQDALRLAQGLWLGAPAAPSSSRR